MSRSKKNWDSLVDGGGQYILQFNEKGEITTPIAGGPVDGQKGEKGDDGQVGERGEDGDKGDPLLFSDLTTDQRLTLKGDEGAQGFPGADGDKGDTGDKGDPLLFADLTADQRESLKGDKGVDGIDGDKGDKLSFSDLTQSDLDAIKGDKGVQGDEGEKGDKLIFSDLTQADLDAIKGVKGETGDTGEKGDTTSAYNVKESVPTAGDLPAGVAGDVRLTEDDQHFYVYDGTSWTDAGSITPVKGEKGDDGDAGNDGEKGDKLAFSDLTEAEKLSLKGEKGVDGAVGADGADGDKGDKLEFSDLTNAEKLSLKGDTGAEGEKGDKLLFADLTTDERLSLKGETGQKGDKLEFSDLSAAEKESLKGQQGDAGQSITGSPGEDGAKGEPLRFDDLTDAEKLSLKGQTGANGAKGDDGDSAYEVYVLGVDPNDTPLSQSQWLETLKGEKGEKGEFTAIDEFYTKGQSDTRYVAKTGDTMTGDLSLSNGTNINFAGDNTGINLRSPYWGGLKYDGKLTLEWKDDRINMAQDLNMKTGNVDLSSSQAQLDYDGTSGVNPAHRIHWLKPPEHKYDATNKEYVDSLKDLYVNKAGDTMTGALTLEAAYDANTPSDLSVRSMRNGAIYTDLRFYVDTRSNISADGVKKISLSRYDSYFYGDSSFRTRDGASAYLRTSGNSDNASECQVSYLGAITENEHIATKEYVDTAKGIVKIYEGGPTSAQVGECWYSSNQNTLLIRIS